jgi:endonuclease YncB( thermonuclease family)
VRLVQIDAPELGEGECYAPESRRELERLAPPGTRIEIAADPALDDVDRYGRLLRYVLVDETNVNIELVRRGAATPYFVATEVGTPMSCSTRWSRRAKLTAACGARAG